MSPPRADGLPPDIKAVLVELHELEARLLEGIGGTQTSGLEPMSEQRENLLVRICEALSTLDDPVLRRETLLGMAEANRRITNAAAAALDSTISLSRESAHQRKAISAYGAVLDDPG
jgi:hypothetical protein